MKCNLSNSGAATTPAAQRPVCEGQNNPPGTPHESLQANIGKQATSDALPKDTFHKKAPPAWLAKSVSRGGTAELNLKKTTEPPIRTLSGKTLVAAIQALQKDIRANWGKVFATEGIDQNDWATPKRSHQARWNQRFESANELLENVLIEAELGLLSDSSCFGYFVNNKPLGFMALANNGVNATINVLVTHPGTAGCGGILVASAVKQSAEWGSEGKICLWPKDGDAEKAYLALGFARKNKDDLYLHLDPKTSEKWDRDTLELKKDAGKKYIA